MLPYFTEARIAHTSLFEILEHLTVNVDVLGPGIPEFSDQALLFLGLRVPFQGREPGLELLFRFVQRLRLIEGRVRTLAGVKKYLPWPSPSAYSGRL